MEYKERDKLVFYAGLRVNRMQCVLSKACVINTLSDDKCVKLLENRCSQSSWHYLNCNFLVNNCER